MKLGRYSTKIPTILRTGIYVHIEGGCQIAGKEESPMRRVLWETILLKFWLSEYSLLQIALREIESAKVSLSEVTSSKVHLGDFQPTKIQVTKIQILKIYRIGTLKASVKFCNSSLTKHCILGGF